MREHRTQHAVNPNRRAKNQLPSVNRPATPLLLQRASADPSSLTAVDVLQLQRTIGNRATIGLLSKSAPLQAKLKLGPAGDRYEREADHVAQKVVRQIERPRTVQRDDEEEKRIQPLRENDAQISASMNYTDVSRASQKGLGVRRKESAADLLLRMKTPSQDSGAAQTVNSEGHPKIRRSISSVGGERIQARLMNLDTFKQRKAAATTKKSIGPLIQINRSTKDIEKIYNNYRTLVRKGRYAQAALELNNLDAKLNRMAMKTYWTSNQARDQLLNEMRTGVQTERQWLLHEQGAQTGAPQALGQNIGGGITPLANRPKASLTMGQGLTVDLGQMILFSDEFSSCSPIVMFNANTRIGGLFHFPANNLDGQRGNLHNMYNQVQPTEIHLNDRNTNDGFGFGQSNDLADLQNFFQQDCNFAGNLHQIAMKGNQYAITLDNNGGVDISNDFHTNGGHLDATHDRTGNERVALDHAWQNAPATTKYGRDDWHSD